MINSNSLISLRVVRCNYYLYFIKNVETFGVSINYYFMSFITNTDNPHYLFYFDSPISKYNGLKTNKNIFDYSFGL